MNNELYHYGVQGMRWGQHKGLYKTQSRSTKWGKFYDKLLAKQNKRVGNVKLKSKYNPLYQARIKEQEFLKNKRDEKRGIAEACQFLIDTDDPIEKFMNKCDKAIDNGINYVANNQDLIKKHIINYNNKLGGDN